MKCVPNRLICARCFADRLVCFFCVLHLLSFQACLILRPVLFFAASAAFVRSLIRRASSCAITAIIPIVKLFASGISQATNETPDRCNSSCKFSKNAALRLSLSNFAMSSVVLFALQCAIAWANTGRSFFCLIRLQ